MIERDRTILLSQVPIFIKKAVILSVKNFAVVK